MTSLAKRELCDQHCSVHVCGINSFKPSITTANLGVLQSQLTIHCSCNVLHIPKTPIALSDSVSPWCPPFHGQSSEGWREFSTSNLVQRHRLDNRSGEACTPAVAMPLLLTASIQIDQPESQVADLTCKIQEARFWVRHLAGFPPICTWPRGPASLLKAASRSTNVGFLLQRPWTICKEMVRACRVSDFPPDLTQRPGSAAWDKIPSPSGHGWQPGPMRAC